MNERLLSGETKRRSLCSASAKIKKMETKIRKELAAEYYCKYTVGASRVVRYNSRRIWNYAHQRSFVADGGIEEVGFALLSS